MWIMEIVVAVGGRFHADRMVDALLAVGHDARLLTSLPRSRFPALDPRRVESVLFPEIVFRAARKIGLDNWGDLFKMRAFGRAVARKMGHPDRFVGWSSFSLEALESKRFKRGILVRDSAHIDFQNEVLEAEYRRVGIRYPDRRICRDREVREYALADRILVLSEFARRTFVDRGIPDDKIRVVRLGVDLDRFQDADLMNSGRPLKVLYFGAISLQKGVAHLLEATAEFSRAALTLDLIGSLEPEMKKILARYPHARHEPALPQQALADRLRQYDVFAFPTLHDGFGQTLPQALASGLAVLTTPNCGASELIHEGENGFLLPVADASAWRRKLLELTDDPKLVQRLKRRASDTARAWTWQRYAEAVTKAVLEDA